MVLFKLFRKKCPIPPAFPDKPPSSRILWLTTRGGRWPRSSPRVRILLLLLLLPQLVSEIRPDRLAQGGERVSVGLGPLLQQTPRELLQIQLLLPSLLLRPQLPERTRPDRPQEVGLRFSGLARRRC